MAHIHNDPKAFSAEMLAGFVAAYSRYVEQVPGASGVMRRGGATAGKVSVVIGGGSGHYPAFCGVVGPGLADGAVMGDIFTSPSTEQAYRVGKALDGGAGVLFSYGNYAGDVMNFDLAQQRLKAEGVDCRTVLVTDDVASASQAERELRRGVAGDLPVFKVAAAAADRGDSLDEVERLALKANSATFSFGVAFAGCTLPGQSEPLFSVAPGTMDLGLGIHGEPGIETVPLASANELAGILLGPLLAERPDGASRAAVILNGLGATKYEELFVLYSSLGPLMAEAGMEVVMPEVGELVTSLDMAGCSLTITWLDDELEELWLAPADTPAFRRDGVGGGHSTILDRSNGIELSDTASEEVGPSAEKPNREMGPSEARSVENAKAGFRAMFAAIKANETELGRLDAVAGDGDHGLGMVRGMRGALESAEESNGGLSSLFVSAGAAFADRAGGSSGALWGAFLGGIGNGLPDNRAATASEVAEAMKAGAKALVELGKCELGDKTMYDSLAPFVEELAEGVANNVGLPAAWAAAAEESTAAAVATSPMRPRRGRARPLADRSVGTPDPGAVSMALCMTSIGEALAEA